MGIPMFGVLSIDVKLWIRRKLERILPAARVLANLFWWRMKESHGFQATRVQFRKLLRKTVQPDIAHRAPGIPVNQQEQRPTRELLQRHLSTADALHGKRRRGLFRLKSHRLAFEHAVLGKKTNSEQQSQCVQNSLIRKSKKTSLATLATVAVSADRAAATTTCDHRREQQQHQRTRLGHQDLRSVEREYITTARQPERDIRPHVRPRSAWNRRDAAFVEIPIQPRITRGKCNRRARS
jgi:hypothetical protein